MPSRDVVASINISSLAAAASSASTRSTRCEWVTVVLVLVIEVFVSTSLLLVVVWFDLSTAVCFSVVVDGADFVDGNDAVDWSVDGVVKSLFSNFPVDEANDDVVEGDSVVVKSSSQLFC
jgi:hypothetical protein